MKNQNALTIASIALGTAALTVLTFWSSSLEAGPEAESAPAKIATPKLVIHGIEMSISPAESRNFKAGDEPVFELRAVNLAHQPASAEVKIAMTATTPASMLSRVARAPSPLWQQSQALTLKADETQVIRVTAPAKLPTNAMVSVTLQPSPTSKAVPANLANQPQVQSADNPQISLLALNFSTIVPQASPSAAR